MSALSNLKLSNTKRTAALAPIQVRRNKLSGKLADQIQLALAQQQGETYTTNRFKTVANEDGSRKTVEIQRRVRPMWWTNTDGKICLNVRYGSKQLELAKGKPTVDVGAADHLVGILQIIKTAVEVGELDAQIEAASGALRSGFKR
jgi:predicted nicotinamide N-methyase